jgi:hypothetical protein
VVHSRALSRLPEILAPAGDDDSLAAALAAGADAVYFGLDGGLNARARATNFNVERLPSIVDTIHRAGVRAYVTLNTLVFEHELSFVETVLRACASAGVDSIIVQDPAVALLARVVAPIRISSGFKLSSTGSRYCFLILGENGRSFVQLNTTVIPCSFSQRSFTAAILLPSHKPGRISCASSAIYYYQ